MPVALISAAVDRKWVEVNMLRTQADMNILLAMSVIPQQKYLTWYWTTNFTFGLSGTTRQFIMMKNNWFHLSVLACIGCCTLPFIIGAASGIAVISKDAWICGGVLLGSMIWLITRYRRTRKINGSCATDCNCKPHQD